MLEVSHQNSHLNEKTANELWQFWYEGTKLMHEIHFNECMSCCPECFILYSFACLHGLAERWGGYNIKTATSPDYIGYFLYIKDIPTGDTWKKQKQCFPVFSVVPDNWFQLKHHCECSAIRSIDPQIFRSLDSYRNVHLLCLPCWESSFNWKAH